MFQIIHHLKSQSIIDVRTPFGILASHSFWNQPDVGVFQQFKNEC